MGQELARWARRYGVRFASNPFSFRSNTLRLVRGAVASQRLAVFDAYHRAVFDAVWRSPVDLGEQATFRSALQTDEAVGRGVFGAPTFFVGENMFWGNDRLDWVEEALRRVEGRGSR
jgi:2-hydroxychromene-2-carboxylate isomerase